MNIMELTEKARLNGINVMREALAEYCPVQYYTYKGTPFMVIHSCFGKMVLNRIKAEKVTVRMQDIAKLMAALPDIGIIVVDGEVFTNAEAKIVIERAEEIERFANIPSPASGDSPLAGGEPVKFTELYEGEDIESYELRIKNEE